MIIILSHSGVRGSRNIAREPSTQTRRIQSRKPRQSGNAGFTIVELLIVLAIAGVLVSLAVPGFSGLILNSKLDGGVDKVTRAFSLARNLSLNNNANERTVICPITNPEANPPTCEATTVTDYQTGWMIFTDCDGDQILDNPAIAADCNGDGFASTAVGDVENLIRVQVELSDISVDSTDTNRIVFDRFGNPQNLVTFNIDKDSVNFASISINGLGRMNVVHNPGFY